MDRARLLDRIERAQIGSIVKNRNCISTALFISGVTPEEKQGIEPWDAHKFVGNLPLGNPQPGSILALRRKEPHVTGTPYFAHMAVVVDVNPLRLVHRMSHLAPLTFLETPAEVADLNTSYSDCEPVYINPHS